MLCEFILTHFRCKFLIYNCHTNMFIVQIMMICIPTGSPLPLLICGCPKAFLRLHHIPGAPRNSLPSNFHRGPFPQELPPPPPRSHTSHPKTSTLTTHIPIKGFYQACGSISTLSQSSPYPHLPKTPRGGPAVSQAKTCQSFEVCQLCEPPSSQFCPQLC